MTTWWVGLVAMLSTLVGQADDHPACLALGGLDTQRAAAFATGSTSHLARVYADDAASAPDRVLVRDYRTRGLRLAGLAMSRISCRAVSASPRRVRLDVVDRLGATWAIEPGGAATRLPRDHPTRHVVVLVAGPDGWRVSAVRR